MNISDQVFRYVYGEMSVKEAAAFEEKLLPGTILKEEVDQLMDLLNEVESLPKNYKPRQDTIDKILKFSKSYKKATVTGKKASS